MAFRSLPKKSCSKPGPQRALPPTKKRTNSTPGKYKHAAKRRVQTLLAELDAQTSLVMGSLAENARHVAPTSSEATTHSSKPNPQQLIQQKRDQQIDDYERTRQDIQSVTGHVMGLMR
ncbi:hypothetical protein H4R34_000406 [Dimargaris verticillata]|uniref:Uncharacterized protein n=1 Tax=Dimargaris verticillata TaxID=2761393 RepID=A0A9W8B887_9FUNG|nr:hypothetical protein H4R34_000406 [Dimargaris verticillata]